MLYITGDIHIPYDDITKLSSKYFPEQKQLTKKDYVLICGDFGGVWSAVGEPEKKDVQYWIKWLKEKNFTTLFIDGNHENFDKLKAFPETDLLGGRAHIIDDGIYHLMRGYVYEIAGKKVFAMGGASSHDKELRTEGKSWWREELPLPEEYLRARRSLDSCLWKVDIVVTHCAPTSVQAQIKPHYAADELTAFLEELENRVKFKKWFFGHYHTDRELDEKHTAVFYKIHDANGI